MVIDWLGVVFAVATFLNRVFSSNKFALGHRSLIRLNATHVLLHRVRHLQVLDLLLLLSRALRGLDLSHELLVLFWIVHAFLDQILTLSKYSLCFLNIRLVFLFLLLLVIVVALVDLFHAAVAQVYLGITDFLRIIRDLDDDMVRHALLRVQAETVLG